MSARARAREDLLKKAEARARDLEGAITKAFPEIRRVTVELGTRSSVDVNGNEVHVYGYGVNLYVSSTDRPDAELAIDVSAPDLEVSRKIEESLRTIPASRFA